MKLCKSRRSPALLYRYAWITVCKAAYVQAQRRNYHRIALDVHRLVSREKSLHALSSTFSSTPSTKISQETAQCPGITPLRLMRLRRNCSAPRTLAVRERAKNALEICGLDVDGRVLRTHRILLNPQPSQGTAKAIILGLRQRW